MILTRENKNTIKEYLGLGINDQIPSDFLDIIADMSRLNRLFTGREATGPEQVAIVCVFYKNLQELKAGFSKDTQKIELPVNYNKVNLDEAKRIATSLGIEIVDGDTKGSLIEKINGTVS